PGGARLLARAPAVTGAANAALRSALLRPAVAWAAGVDRRRALPAFAPVTFRRWFSDFRRERERGAGAGRADGRGRNGEVVLFVDTFTAALSPEVGKATVRGRDHAAYRVTVTGRPVCGGITWISTGQLTGACAETRRT